VLQLELGPGVLGEEDGVADLHLHGDLLALVAHAAGADGDDRAALRPLGAGVGQDDAAAGGLLARGGLDHHAVAQRADLRRGCGFAHGSSTSSGVGRPVRWAAGARRASTRAPRVLTPPSYASRPAR